MNIHLVPSFHYDVVYLKPYNEYLEQSLKIIDKALDILAADADYTFTIEQVILLEEFWTRYPERRKALKEFAAAGRIEFAPGMYVMPDMNMIDGESMFMQTKVGFDWLQRTLGITPRACWIADCWGHHAQLPQILSSAGYDYYFFYRCMRRETAQNNFIWQGIDGTGIKTHWLATGYANLHFPDAVQVENILELDLAGVNPADINRLAETIRRFGDNDDLMICNGGDFCSPQNTAPAVVKKLNASKQTLPIDFSTPSHFMDGLDWQNKPVVNGEFNSLFQGSFTSNIRIKQRNHYLGQRLQALEKLAAVTGQSADFSTQWKILLKQQFHDAICGTICDAALDEIYRDFDRLESALDATHLTLSSEADDAVAAWFNPLSFPRQEIVTHKNSRHLIKIPALGIATLDDATVNPETTLTALPCRFANAFYQAEINTQGYIRSLKTTEQKEELVATAHSQFGTLSLQMDYGDLWMNFDGPIDGGSFEAAFTQNVPDPLQREEKAVINRKTVFPNIKAVQAWQSQNELIIRQEGELNFWTIKVPFSTEIIFSAHSPTIRYRTEVMPQGRHFRIRAAFPSTIKNGEIMHEIPFGIQKRESGEHVAQAWIDYADHSGGLSMFNRGTPANNVDNGCLLLTLFRSAAMEYKTTSVKSFNENIRHTFEYAIMPHGAPDFSEIVRQAKQFSTPPEPIIAKPVANAESAWEFSAANVHIAALRNHGDELFLRVYEAIGTSTTTTLTLPSNISAVATANGVEQQLAPFSPVQNRLEITFRPFEVKSFLLQKAGR